MLIVAALAILSLILLGLMGPLYARIGHATAIAYAGAAGACGVLLLLGLAALIGGGPAATASLPLGLPWLSAHFRIDALSAFFMVVVNLGGAAAALYGIGYGRHESHPGRVLAFFSPFLGAMNMVLLADDAFAFLLSWESMSLCSWLLVVSNHRQADNLHAGYVYLVMAGIGTFALLLGFGLLAGPVGGYAFDTIRAAPASAGIAAMVVLLALLGAGSKAGLVPLHAWLPLAHPAAPSHVSALMSGVMTKVAIYGFLRIVFDLLGEPQWWWGLAVLMLGGLTAVMGVLYALMQTDLKRLLAYSTVENIGVIFISLGLALAFQAQGMREAAALALVAALLHGFNHSLFKSLLFFGAGAVLTASGLRDMERLGGLIHRMPLTALCFLVGCGAISALPPLNGFVSEWMMFQAILLSPQVSDWTLRFAIPAVGAVLALSAALAATCFVRAYGIVFLGRPRSAEAEAAAESDSWQTGAMAALAAMCFLAGIAPALLVDLVGPVASLLVGNRLSPQLGLPWLTLIPVGEARSSYNGLLLLLFIVFATVAPALIIHRLATRATRRSAAWDCGTPGRDPLTQYSAGSFAQPIRRVFGAMAFRAREHVDMPLPGDMRAARFHVDLKDIAWDLCYAPVAEGIAAASLRMNRLQFLTIRSYLTLVFSALVALLLVLALWR